MDDRRKLEVAGWALAAFVLVFLAVRFLHHGAAAAAPVTVGGPGAADAPAPSSHGSAGRPHKLLVVDVEGEVRRPGIQRVPSGARAAAAVTQAGGLTGRGDATAVNLAAPLHDGQQVVVPRRGAAVASAPASDPAAAAGGTGAGAASGAPAPPVSLSSATVAQLDTLDGIGPTLAQRIVQYREAHGGFRSVDELKQVEGIGEKRFESLKAGLTP
jgi:competence protein ComEA